MSHEPRDERDVDEALKAIFTPEFDTEFKRLHAASKGGSSSHIVMASEMGNQLRRSINDLYATFSSYRMNDAFSYCDHCISDEDFTRLCKTPLRELTHDDLWSVAMNVMSTTDDLQGFRYFLPRLIEGLVDEALYTSEVIFRLISRGGYSGWERRERDSMGRYLGTQFEVNLSIMPSMSDGIWNMATLLCCVGNLAVGLSPFLERWTAREDKTARYHLLEFARQYERSQPIGLGNDFWSRDAAEQVVAWLKEPQTIATIEAACAVGVSEPDDGNAV